MARKVLVIGSSGAGKALVDTEPVATPNGWVQIGDIKVGDYVFDEKGEATKVLKTHKYNEQVYRVFFKDGSYIDTCKNHKWKIGFSSHGSIKFDVYDTVTVKNKIDNRVNKKLKYNRYFIPVTEPVKYSKKDLPLNPYLLGVLLGDGCFRQKHIYFSNIEQDIVDKVNNILKDDFENLVFNKNEYTQCQYILQYNNEYDKVLGKRNKIKKGLSVILESLGLGNKKSFDKFIPEIFLRSSVEDRLELLKGLFDTDGCVNKGRKSISSVSFKLIKGIEDLANSLGIITTIRKDYREGKECYYISFLTNKKIWSSDKHEFRYNSHISDKTSNRFNHDDRIYITKIEVLDDVKPMTCLEVESEYHTFLTKGYKVTHNSTSLRNLDPNETAIIKCMNKELPFKKGDSKFKSVVCQKADEVVKNVSLILQKAPHIKNIVIDDLIYLSVQTFMNRSKEKGFDKFTDLASELYSVLTLPDIVQRDDITFIYLTHSETNPTTMETNVRTIGKVISEKVVPEGLFTIVLEAQCDNGEYKFLTHNITGNSVVKSPLGMFEEDYIDNDLSIVLKAIKEYY